MAVSNGQNANETTFNNAFISKTQNSTAAGKITLDNAEVASGSTVDNSQAEHNSIAAFIGKTINAAYNSLPAWASTNFGAANATVKVKVEALDAEIVNRISDSEKGAVNGVATLDANGKVPDIQIRLDNDSYLQARNFADSGDVNLIKANTSDEPVIESPNLFYGPYTDINFWGTEGFGITAPNDATTDHVMIGVQDHPNDSTNTAPDISIQTGYKGGALSTGNTGTVWMTTGSNDGSGNTGQFQFYTGQANSGNSGQVSISSGGSTSGSSGDVSLYSQGGGNGSGDASLRTGSGGTGQTGDIILSIGGTSGTVGQFLFQKAGIFPSIGDVWTATSTFGHGYWAAPAASGSTNGREAFTLDGTDITNGYVDLMEVALANSIRFHVSGLLSDEGVDYTVNLTGGAGGNTRLTFSAHTPTLAAGDKVIVYYEY